MSTAKIFFAIWILLISLPGTSLSQDGPGGVGSKDGASNLSLWLDAGNISGFGDGEDIAGWSDISGNNNHARVGTNAPSFSLAGGGNGQPAVSFVAANNEDLFVISNPEIFPTTELSVYVVSTMDISDTGPDSDNWGSLISTSDDNSWNDGWAICRNNATSDMLLYVNNFFPLSPGENVCTQPIPASNGIWSLIYNATENTGYGSVNASVCSFAYSGALNYNGGTNDNLLIGAGTNDSGPFYHLNGAISEVIQYDVALNTAQAIIVQNYLAAKYGIALNTNDIYSQDDNANGDYDFDVAGIGQVDASNSHQDSQGGIVRILNPTHLDDDEFLLWGHDDNALEATETTDKPADFDARLSRSWRVSEVNAAGVAIDVGDVDIRFDLSSFTSVFAQDLGLLIDTDDDGLFADETAITGATDLGNGIFEFDFSPAPGTGISDSRRFTLGTSNANRTTLFDNDIGINGPGGVGGTDGSTRLSLWLDASEIAGATDGADLSEWLDLSGNGYNVTVPANAPSYSLTGAGNGLPTVNFDNANSEYLSVSTNGEIMPVNSLSLFVVGSFESTSNRFGSLISTSDDNAWNDGWGIGRNQATSEVGFYVNNWINWRTMAIDFGTNHIWGITYNPSTAQGFGMKSEDTVNVTLSGSINYNGGVNDHLLLGTATNDAGPFYFMNGDISEVIIYSEAMNDAQRIIITNYLSSKYDIVLDENDVFDEDTPGNGNYDHEVAGVGKVDASNIHACAKGTGIVQVEVSNTSNPEFENNEFFLWGHDNVSLSETNITDVPTGVERRLTRVWRVSEMDLAGSTADLGAVDITFHLGNQGFQNVSADDLVLLVDADNDGDFDISSTTVIDNPIDLGGNSFAFNAVTSLEDNLRFTLATTNASNTTLPVELAAFKLMGNGQGQVHVSWQTTSETNNDYFTVERSNNSVDWHELARVEGAGNSSSLLLYEMLDVGPFKGRSYYRLTQTDFDGRFERFETKTIVVNDLVRAERFYPNPAQDYLMFSASLEGFQVWGLTGKDLTGSVTVDKSAGTQKLDISRLMKGTYLLKVGVSVYRFVKE